MKYEIIASRRSPTARKAAALGSSARARRESGLFLCEGARLCQDAALSGLEIQACFFTPEALERILKQQ